MSSFEEIKGLFTNEIINSPQYQVALKIKNLVIADIQSPNINFNFQYQLEDIDYVNINNKNNEEYIMIFALKLILGFFVEIINGCIIIEMKKFLE